MANTNINIRMDADLKRQFEAFCADTLEVAWEPTGPACWYISTPGFKGVCPVGLFVKV